MRAMRENYGRADFWCDQFDASLRAVAGSQAIKDRIQANRLARETVPATETVSVG